MIQKQMRLVNNPKRQQQPNQGQMRDSMSSVDLSRSSMGYNDQSPEPESPNFTGGNDVYSPSTGTRPNKRLSAQPMPLSFLDESKEHEESPDHY
jgi:hypothetical protein